jgi:hypothetical protein
MLDDYLMTLEGELHEFKTSLTVSLNRVFDSGKENPQEIKDRMMIRTDITGDASRLKKESSP